MAGTILISNTSAVVFNSVSFDLVSEVKRDVLKAYYPALIEPVYEPKDLGFMSFISLEALDQKRLKQFCDATKTAYNVWREKNDTPFPEWEELVEKLDADIRV